MTPATAVYMAMARLSQRPGTLAVGQIHNPHLLADFARDFCDEFKLGGPDFDTVYPLEPLEAPLSDDPMTLYFEPLPRTKKRS